VVYKSVVLKLSPFELWSILTEKEKLAQWWNKGVRLEALVGGDFFEPWGKDGLATGKVVALKPFEMMTFSWVEKYFEKSEKTICTFRLKKVPGGTKLEVIHEGWSSFKDEKKRSNLVLGFRKGWDMLLLKLEKYVKKTKA